MESLKTPGTVLGLASAVLGLIGTASAVVISWGNAKRQARSDVRQAGSQAIDDLDQVRKALMEEIGRLSSRIDELESENVDLKAKVKELRVENTRLEQRVSELEAELKSLRRL